MDSRKEYIIDFTIKGRSGVHTMTITAGDDKPFDDILRGWASAVRQAGHDVNIFDYIWTIPDGKVVGILEIIKTPRKLGLKADDVIIIRHRSDSDGYVARTGDAE